MRRTYPPSAYIRSRRSVESTACFIPSKAGLSSSFQTGAFFYPFLVFSRLLLSMALMRAVDTGCILISPE